MDTPLGTTISLKIEQGEEEIEGRFIGAETSSFFIVRLQVEIDPSMLHKGQTALVSYLSSGVKYKFESSVLYYIKKYQLMILSHPETYESLSLRKEQRINCHIPATANVDRRSLRGLITDISHHGCQFIVKIPTTFKLSRVSVLTDIDLSLAMFEQPETANLKGKVRNTSVDKFKIALGIEFDQLEERFSQRLKSFIEDLEELQ